MLRVGVVGLGTIGKSVCRALDAGLPNLHLVGGLSRNETRATDFLTSLASAPPFLPLSKLIEASDIVVEAATRAALEDLAPQVLEAGRDLLVMSVGALLDHPEWIALAERHGARIHVPSGAIAGLDGVKAACLGSVERITMETRKSPASLAGAPYLVEHGVTVERLTEETLLYEGPAREACRGFPANVNVVAALSLAGLGPDATRIRILAVPGLTRNVHDIRVEGSFGTLNVHIENVPSVENPRTGRLAALSAIAALRDLVSPLRLGA